MTVIRPFRSPACFPPSICITLHNIFEIMLNAGEYHKLTVNRISDFGLYLVNDDGDEVLLPNRYVSLENKVGDQMDVFVYHDSEDRLVASTEKPYAAVGDITALKVVDKTVHGAFLDWGLTAKDIFLPNRNMSGLVKADSKVVVYVYRDKITGRAVASMALREVVSNVDMQLKRGQKVDVIVALELETGYRVVINGKHWGMIYKNQLYRPVAIGDRMEAYVRRITEDNRVDLSLQQEGYNEVKTSADKLLDLLRKAGGKLAVHDDSTPERVTSVTGMSKKVFKRTVGFLMKRGDIVMTEKGIEIAK